MDGDNKSVISLVKKPAVDDALVSFLEKQLQLAKDGKICQFACTSITDDENDFVYKFYARPVKSYWMHPLGFVELLHQEQQRIRKMITETFLGER